MKVAIANVWKSAAELLCTATWSDARERSKKVTIMHTECTHTQICICIYNNYIYIHMYVCISIIYIHIHTNMQYSVQWCALGFG